MGLVKKIDVTSELIFRHITDYDIFYAYRDGDIEIGGIESSKFREDINASAGFYVNSKNKIIYSDIATGEKLDCFAYVSKLFGLTYKQALIKVAVDFGLTGQIPKYYKADPNEVAHKREKEEKRIEILEDTWSKGYIDYWKQFYLTKEEIEQDVKPVKALFINGKIIPNYAKTIRFAYPLTHESKTYYKVYSPYAEKGNYRWINNIPLYMPFGITTLPFKSKTLIITKALKDVLIFRKHFSEVIGLQNESMSALRDVTIQYLKKKYKTIYINTDLDAAGKEALNYFVGKGFEPLMLPDLIYTKHGLKDIADFTKEFGIKRFEDFLKYKKLI